MLSLLFEYINLGHTSTAKNNCRNDGVIVYVVGCVEQVGIILCGAVLNINLALQFAALGRDINILCMAFSIFNHLRSCENCGDSDDVIVDLRKNLAVHLAHELSANVKPQPAATNVFRIYSAPKALENMRKIVLHKRTTTVKETSRSAMTASAAGCAKPGTEYPEKTSSWT